MADNNTNSVKTAKKQQVGVPFTKDDPRINREGRPKGSGISITTEIKKKLAKVPKGQKATYLQLLINRIFKQAIQDGDQQMIKNIWNYVDGLPNQPHGVTGSITIRIDKDLKLDGNSETIYPTPESEDDSSVEG